MGAKKKPPQSARELLHRYAAGEREFSDASLAHENLSGTDLTAMSLRRANLTGVDLSNAGLIGVDFSDTDLTGADLSGANLSGANLRSTHLNGVDLRNACLTVTNLVEANLTDANLGDADLTEANLGGAVLTEANLTGADFGGAALSRAHLLEIDLSPLCDAVPPIMHYGSSMVDYGSVVRSLRSPNLKTFLQRTGMPEVVIEALITSARQLQKESPGMLQSTFLSYGGPDEVFARKLYEALHKNGVTTFFFPEHAVPGKKIGRTTRQGVNDYDRVVLVCSKGSLDRDGVLAEIEEVLDRERRGGGAELVIPVLLDDHFLSGWTPTRSDVALTLRERVAIDFKRWDTDPTKFDTGLRKLILALKK